MSSCQLYMSLFVWVGGCRANKILVEKILAQRNVWSKKYLGQKKFGSKIFWSPKIEARKKLGPKNFVKIGPAKAEILLINANVSRLASGKDGSRNLSLKFGQNWVSNS